MRGRGGKLNVCLSRAATTATAKGLNGVEVHACLGAAGREEFAQLHNAILEPPLSREALAFIEQMHESLRETALAEYLPKSPDWFERRVAWLYVRRVEDADRWAEFIATRWEEILERADASPSALW